MTIKPTIGTGKFVKSVSILALTMFFTGLGAALASADQSKGTVLGIVLCFLGVLLWVCARIGAHSTTPSDSPREGHRLQEKNHRKYALMIFAGLVVLSVLACLPYAPQGPFNPVNYTRLPGMRLVQHRWTALIEPFFAPLKIIAGAPDFKIAAGVSLLWLFLGAVGWRIFSECKKGKNFFSAVQRGIGSGVVASLTVTLLICFFALARIPGWKLVVRDPNLIVADLHCHTVISHDALVSQQTNIDWHESSGYNMEAITENEHLVDHRIEGFSPSALHRMPALMSGVEDHTGARAICVALCPNPDIRLGNSVHHAAWFAEKIHREGGALWVCTLKNLRTSDIARLANDGVDGFEIANEGHPDLPLRLRREVLAVARARGLVLLANSDYHGWCGLARTWNVIKAPGKAGPPRSRRIAIVLRTLRRHDTADFTPVVAGFMGYPSALRAVFSPFVETARYAMELSPVRVLSWWVWAWVLFLLWMLLDRKGFPAGDILLASLVWVSGAGMIGAGIDIIGQGRGSTDFGLVVGFSAAGVGAIALLVATVRGVGFVTKCVKNEGLIRS
ncbi:MAG: PHP domain-containing protein [Syntrophobacteraceae bacterium]